MELQLHLGVIIEYLTESIINPFQNQESLRVNAGILCFLSDDRAKQNLKPQTEIVVAALAQKPTPS